jgi:hypothetical protein
MSTRSRIGISRADGTIISIYSHWDGYPKGVGATLKKYYKNSAKILQLMELGDISVLGKNIGTKHSFEIASETDETTAYGRDRGEKGVEAQISKSLEDFVKLADNSGAEYAYLWEKGKWKTMKI